MKYEVTLTVIKFPGSSINDIDPDQIVKAATGLELVIVIGLTASQNLYVATSSGYVPINNWLIDEAKRAILDDE